MLSRVYRLTKQEDFKHIFQKGRKIFGNFFSVRYLPNNLKNSRFAVVVANKVSKKAVVRNKLKRQVREIIKSSQNKLDKNYDIIINVLLPCLEKNFNFLKEELVKIILTIK